MTSTAALSPLDTYLSCPGPARELLRALAGRVRSTLQPPPRAQSIAATLDEIADMPEVAALELTALQLCDAFRALSLPEAEDSPATAARPSIATTPGTHGGARAGTGGRNFH
jgi:hypothetical protein